MSTPAIYDALNFPEKTVGKNIIKELICVQEGLDNTGSYIKVNELRDLVKATMKVIIDNPAKIEDIHRKTEKCSTDFFNYAKSVFKKDLAKLPNRELAKIHKKMSDLFKFSHGYAIPTTWFVDSDGEDLSNYLIGKVKKIIKKQKSKLSFAEVFSVITTPVKMSFAMKEEIESLKILQDIKKDQLAKKIFFQTDVKKIEAGLDKINKSLKKKIISHYKKWRWTPFTYWGPAYDLDFYLEVWSGLLRQKIDIESRLNKLLNFSQKTKEEKAGLIKNLKISKEDVRLFEIAAEIIHLKAYRKDCLFYAMFVQEGLMKEIGRRLNLSLKQTWYLADWEVAGALADNYFPADILNQRFKFSVYYQKGKIGVIYTGAKAKNFLKKFNFEKEKIIKTDHLTGTSACPGKVSGVVKLVDLPEEMGKMNQGDIMVAHTTFPSLVPAMKKASAIITDDGGITCHAAIVARELKTPCVVGTKIATQVLKDGDEVEVDAERGIVKILKKK